MSPMVPEGRDLNPETLARAARRVRRLRAMTVPPVDSSSAHAPVDAGYAPASADGGAAA